MLMMIILIIVFLIVDIASKLLVSNFIDVHDSIIIVKDFFYITYVRNTGAAWSMLAGETWLLIIVSLIIIGLICFYIYKNRPKSNFEMVGYSLVLGGAIGNFIDRIVYKAPFFDENLKDFVLKTFKPRTKYLEREIYIKMEENKC